MSEPLHPTLSPARRRALVLEGIELFNRGAYFACHEAWETVWRSTTPEPRQLFQGLIQVGVGMYHHHERGRPDVARRVLAKGCRRLETLDDDCLGLDVAGLLRQVAVWRGWLARCEGRPPPQPHLRMLRPAAVR